MQDSQNCIRQLLCYLFTISIWNASIDKGKLEPTSTCNEPIIYIHENRIVKICGLFYLHGLTLIPTCIRNYMPGKVWIEFTYPFLNFNGCTVEV